MNKLLVLYACGILSISPISGEQKSTVLENQPEVETLRSFEEQVAVSQWDTEVKSEVLLVSNDIKSPFNWSYEYVEKEVVEVIDESVIPTFIMDNESVTTNLDLNDITIVEVEPEIDLGFETENYLPESFDPYTAVVDIHSVDFIEFEEVELGFNTEDYLPEGFNPYEVYFNVHEIEFIEVEEELDFDTSKHLENGFDPYVSQQIDIHSIDFIEMDDEIELGFDTRPYLPEGFDPYERSN